MAIIMLTTTAALLMAGVGILLSDAFLFFGYLQRDLSALSEIVAENNTAALAFDDPRAASETLGALRARPHLITACVFRPDGTVLASYLRTGSNQQCPPPSQSEIIRRSSGIIYTSRPVFLRKQKIGAVCSSTNWMKLRTAQNCSASPLLSCYFSQWESRAFSLPDCEL